VNSLRIHLAEGVPAPLWLGRRATRDSAQAYYRADLPAALVDGRSEDGIGLGGASTVVVDGLVAPLDQVRGQTLRGLGNPTVFRYSGVWGMGLDQVIGSINAAGGNAWLEIDDDLVHFLPADHLATLWRAGLAYTGLPLDRVDWHAIRAAEIAVFAGVARAARGVVVSTPTLATAVRSLNSRVVVGPNVVNPAHFPHRAPRVVEPGGTVRIGYTATGEHARDLALILPALWAIAHQRPIELHLWGWHPLIYTVPTSETHRPGRFHLEGWPIPYLFHGKSSFFDFHQQIGILDIAIAPLEDTLFNAARSPTKWLESALHQTPMVVQDAPPYAALQDEVVVLKARSVEAFYRQILRLVDDAALRWRIGQAAREEVLRNHGPEAGRRAWLAALTKARAG
jgi:glycosyltransferase involved in cell wall biosynthesis